MQIAPDVNGESNKVVPINQDIKTSELGGLNNQGDMFEPISNRIYRLRSQSTDLSSKISITTPLSFEKNREGFISAVKDLLKLQIQWENEYESLKLHICESHPTFTWIQRMIIIFFSFFGKGMDELRMKQLWVLPKLQKQYLELMDEVLKISKKNRENIEALKDFTKSQLRNEFSLTHKTPLMKARKKLIEQNRDFVELVNELSTVTFTDLESILSDNLTVVNSVYVYFENRKTKLSVIWERLLEIQLPPVSLNRGNTATYLYKIKVALSNQFKDIDRKIEEIDDHIDLEIEKLFV